MAKPTPRTHVLQPPRPMNAWEFSSWERLHRPEGRLLMQSFHPEGTDRPPHRPGSEAYGALDPHSEARFERWVCLYEAYDPTTWGLIND